VTTPPAMGCLPAAMTLYGLGTGANECVDRLNNDAVSFNKKLNATSKRLRNRHSSLILVVLDMYQPLLNLATNPTANGTWITTLCSLKHVNL
jgi:hypothetical protein